MTPHSRLERSLRRSKHRARVLLALESGGEWRAGQIASALGLALGRVLWALHGHLPEYQPRLGLVRLGLVRARSTPQGTLYRISASGRALLRGTAAVTGAPKSGAIVPPAAGSADPWGVALSTGPVMVWTVLVP